MIDRSKRPGLLNASSEGIALCSAHLLNDPERRWMPCHVAAKNRSATMADDEEAIQDSERDRGRGEEIHRRNGFAVVAQERQPAFTQNRSLGSPPVPS